MSSLLELCPAPRQRTIPRTVRWRHNRQHPGGPHHLTMHPIIHERILLDTTMRALKQRPAKLGAVHPVEMGLVNPTGRRGFVSAGSIKQAHRKRPLR